MSRALTQRRSGGRSQQQPIPLIVVDEGSPNRYVSSSGIANTSRSQSLRSQQPALSNPPQSSVSSIDDSEQQDSHSPSPQTSPQRDAYTKCKWCSAIVKRKALSSHTTSCPFLPLICDFIDSETGEECGNLVKGRILLAEHRQRCPFGLIPCPNAPSCEMNVSARSLPLHLENCKFAIVQCKECRTEYERTNEEDHRVRCPNVVVACPLECGEHMHRRDVPEHILKTVGSHIPRHPLPCSATTHCFPYDSSATVISLLLHYIRQLEQRTTQHPISENQTFASSSMPLQSTSASPEPQRPPQSPQSRSPIVLATEFSSSATISEGEARSALLQATQRLTELMIPDDNSERLQIFEDIQSEKERIMAAAHSFSLTREKRAFERALLDLQCRLYDSK